MTVHVIAGRLGPSDKVEIPKNASEQLTRLALIQGNRNLQYGIGRALTDLAALSLYPSERGIDLLVLATHVHAADTRITRADSQDSWTREMRLVVPVLEPEIWSGAKQILERMLNFLTGDRWVVGFRQRPKGLSSLSLVAGLLPLSKEYRQINLFSGGLDSLIGAIDQLEAGRDPLFVSHAGDGPTSSAQYELDSALANHFDEKRFNRVRVWMSFEKGLVKKSSPENTTRGRSFLFFAIAAFASSSLEGQISIHAPENGLIALNVPLDPLRVGALSTRTTHPHYIDLWNQLLAAVGFSAQISNPYWDQTKGEMVSNCRNKPLLRDVVELSMSCSSPSKGRWKGLGIQHCGYCYPCLIRRAALSSSLPGGDPTVYTVPKLHGQVLSTNDSEGQQVRSIQLAAARLRERPKLANLLIRKPGPLKGDEGYLAKLAGVYSRGIAEVGVAVKGTKAKPVGD
jgi:hypothetical protein